VHELVTIDTDFIDARFNYETYTVVFQIATVNRNAACGELCPKELQYNTLPYSNPVLYKLLLPWNPFPD